MDTTTLVRFNVVRKETGLKPHTLTRRIRRAGIEFFIDGHDRRQRMIDVRDLPKLIEIEPATREEPTAA